MKMIRLKSYFVPLILFPATVRTVASFCLAPVLSHGRGFVLVLYGRSRVWPQSPAQIGVFFLLCLNL